MEYIKSELERLTGGRVAVQPLFDFIHQYTDRALKSSHECVTAERRSDILQFESHWKSVFPESLTSCLLAYVDGCWLPNLSNENDLGKQVPWDTFTKYYRKGIIPTYHRIDEDPRANYVPSTPMNWDELLKISFWEEMYDLYGNAVVRFIFEKCLLLLPIEESFFVAICHKSVLLNKKIDDYSKPSHRKHKHQPDTWRHLLAVNPGTQLQARSSNPYYTLVRRNPKKKVKIKKGAERARLSRRGRKRERKRGLWQTHNEETLKRKETSSHSVSIFDPPSKKSRLDIDVATVSSSLGTQEKPASIPSFDQSTDQRNLSTKNGTKSRWITPTQRILAEIRKARDALKQPPPAASSSSKVKDTSGSGSSGYTFLNIMKDKYFKGKLGVITKETHSVCGTEKLSKKLDGLILPPTISSSSAPIEITVHRLSEFAAKQLKLRVIPRKRRRRKKPQPCESVSLFSRSGGANSRTSHTSNSKGSGGPGVSTNANGQIDGDGKESANRRQTISPSHQNVIANRILVSTANARPFDPTITLMTSPIIHCQSSGAKWPEMCDMGRATSKSASQSTQGSTVDILLNKIVHSSTTCSYAKENWNASIEQLKKAGKLDKLEAILKQMVQFHTRVQDLNKLMKNCVCFWIAKVSLKEQTREERKQAAVIRKAERQQKKARKKKRIEVIDLTMNTTSTVSTHFSGSANTNSQPHNISAVTTSSASHHHQKDSSGIAQPCIQSFLSTTPNRTLSQRERRKLAFLQLKNSIPHSCILSSLSQILFLSGANLLLGSNCNRKGFLGFVRKSVFLAGMKSALHLGQLMAMVNPEQCPWLSGVENVPMKLHLLAKVLYWFYNEYILVLLKTCFYSTELSNSRFQLTFYLRDTWRSVSDRLKLQLTKKGSLTKIRKTEEQYGKPANGRIRLIPKQNLHIRPILSLDKSVNEKINVPQCKLLLNYICGNLAPHGVCDASSLRQKWKSFLESWKSLKGKPLYYIRLDIRDAYPSVKIDKLAQILADECPKDDVLTAKRFLLVGRKSYPKLSLTNLKNPTNNWYASIFSRPCIVKDADKEFRFDKEKVLQALLKAFTSNVVQIGRHKFTFSHGLPQGWCLSQALCNIYYGHMDKVHFSNFLHNELEFFVRSVDDYFYVSPFPSRIAKFFHKMKCGISDYNCHINPDKSLTNIFIRSNIQAPRSDSEWVRYCGWRFCLGSGHITRDFGSYAGADFCSTLTFLLTKAQNPEEFIYRRMGMIAPARLKYLILDPAINCRERILMTIHEAGLVMAFRFYAACRVLFPNLTSVADPVKGAQLFQSMSWCVVSLSRLVNRNNSHFYSQENVGLHKCYLASNNGPATWAVVPQSTPTRNPKKAIKSKITNDSSGDPICGDPISHLEISFIVYHAFRKKLLMHSSNFNDIILPKLNRKIRMLKKRLVTRSHYFYLIRIIGRTMPAHFCDIKI